MLLEAQSANCFSSQFVLKLDGHPIGKFRGRWFSEGIDIRLTERLQLRFEKQSWLNGTFRLIDTNTEEVLAAGQRAGFFARTWNLELMSGPAQLVATGLFSFSYELVLDEERQRVASASKADWCGRSWQVEGDDSLAATDLVFVGLVYQTILERQRSSSNAGS